VRLEIKRVLHKPGRTVHRFQVDPAGLNLLCDDVFLQGWLFIVGASVITIIYCKAQRMAHRYFNTSALVARALIAQSALALRANPLVGISLAD
jgi:hypothetical protein